ncbi:glucosamine inositolphosphorylceramide transferase family protein, partial [Vibrio mediterranei]|uniref:glucosamine inositolphosphorylceramide transferase family protein n=1 Tax=Vibrio mediterranei TaxID=689 RepID=UPI001EFD72C8
NIYYANSIFDEFYPHENNPVKVNDSETRNAGKIIFLDGDILRFSQDCSESYGQSMKVMKINKLTKHEYQEESIDKIKPDFLNDIIGTHTLNFNDEFLVTDYKVRKLKVAVTYENTFS